MRNVLVLALLLIVPVATARQPVTSPIYYLSTAPRLEVGVPVVGVLTDRAARTSRTGPTSTSSRCAARPAKTSRSSR
jgi:hypothetical protein